MFQNTVRSYGADAKFFHWFMAAGFITLFIMAYTMMPMQPSDTKWTLYGLHKATGVLMFALVVLRLTWKITQPYPLLPTDLPWWHSLGARINYVALYLLMAGMPLSGLTMSLMGGHPVSFYGLWTIKGLVEKHPLSHIAAQAHSIFSIFLLITVCAHIIGALYHHFVRKDDVFKRMLPIKFADKPELVKKNFI